MRRTEARAGFTLIEVLAALAVTAAFVAVALPFASRLAARWWVGEIAVETADGWMQAVARLSDDLSQAIPLSVPQGTGPVAAFSAGPGFVQFVRPALGGPAAFGLETVRFDIEASPSGSVLIRRAGRFEALSFLKDTMRLGAPTTILDGPYRLRFAAYGADHLPHPAWTPQAMLPAGVQLSAVSRPSGAALPTPILLPIVARSLPQITAVNDAATSDAAAPTPAAPQPAAP